MNKTFACTFLKRIDLSMPCDREETGNVIIMCHLQSKYGISDNIVRQTRANCARERKRESI